MTPFKPSKHANRICEPDEVPRQSVAAHVDIRAEPDDRARGSAKTTARHNTKRVRSINDL